MSYFLCQNGELYAEAVTVRQLAESHGTPCYIYSRAALESNYLAYTQALGSVEHMVCYAVKANSNLAVLNILARLGAGFDIVSGGELDRVIAAGGDPRRIVFSGVAKTVEEMRKALEANIYCFNLESVAELDRLSKVAASMGKTAAVSIRVNPDVDAKTHPYISTGLRENKFGINIVDALAVYKHADQLPSINVQGIDCHIGSQLTELPPFLDALDRILELLDQLDSSGISISHLDLGGGLGVSYRDETPPTPAQYSQAILAKLGARSLKLLFEPGRSIVADAGILVTRVEYVKSNQDKNFAIVDAAMNDMIRPALYQAWLPIDQVSECDAPQQHYDIVGPVCETGDFLGKDRILALRAGDLLSVGYAGAYGFTMSSNYNSRTRAAELMVDGEKSYLIRERESFADLIKGENLLPETA